MMDPSKLLPRGPGFGFNPLGRVAIRDPRMRIVFLVVCLIVMVGIWMSLNQYAKSPAAREVSPDVPTPEVKIEAFTGVPALDMGIAERLTDSGPDARRRWPGEAVHYLLLEAANTPAVYAYARNLLPLSQGSAAEIEKDSRPWRFKYVRFRGELEYLREEDYEATYGPPAPTRDLVWRGRVRVPGEPPVRVVFVTVAMPAWADTNEPGVPETKLIEDGWVRGRGILVENYVDTTEGGDGVPALLVVATQLERDFAPVPVESFDDIPFQIIDDDPAIKDAEGAATLAKDYPRPLFRLVKYAEGMAGAEGAARRAEKGVKPERLATKKAWEELVGQPSKFRGKYFRGLGAMADTPMLYVPETIPPNDAGIEECLNGWIVTDEQKLMQFIAPASLDTGWRRKARIRWEGFFYKTKLYQARDGSQRLAPVFVLTVLEEVKIPKPSTTVPIILGATFVFGTALFAWIVLREDRTKESYRRLRRRRVAESAAERPAD